MPKTSFPSLVVVPYNLVPSCSDCNKAKLAEVPKNAETQTLHPYYDDVTDEQWLYAEVIQTVPAAFKFFIAAPSGWHDTLKARVQHHFVAFSLGALYASEAAVELADIRHQLINQFDIEGETGVLKHLKGAALSRSANHKNSWQTAMYQAMVNSDWFCGGGFRDV